MNFFDKVEIVHLVYTVLGAALSGVAYYLGRSIYFRVVFKVRSFFNQLSIVTDGVSEIKVLMNQHIEKSDANYRELKLDNSEIKADIHALKESDARQNGMLEVLKPNGKTE